MSSIQPCPRPHEKTKQTMINKIRDQCLSGLLL